MRQKGRWLKRPFWTDWLSWWIALQAGATLWLAVSSDFRWVPRGNLLALGVFLLLDWLLGRFLLAFVAFVGPFILYRRLWRDRREADARTGQASDNTSPEDAQGEQVADPKPRNHLPTRGND